MIRSRFEFLAGLLAAAVLVGCGGGGDAPEGNEQPLESLAATEQERMPARQSTAVEGATPRTGSTTSIHSALRQLASSGGVKPPEPGGFISSTQQHFEDLALKPNAGYYTFYVAVSGDPSPSSVGAFSQTTIAQSPATTGGFVQSEYVPRKAFRGVSLHRDWDEQTPRSGTYGVVNGSIVFRSSLLSPQFGYESDAVLMRRVVQGVIVDEARYTSIEKVPLSGSLADAPFEFHEAFIYGRTAVWDRGGTFLPGAAYYRFQGTMTGDVLSLGTTYDYGLQAWVPVPLQNVKSLADLNQPSLEKRTIHGVPCLIAQNPNDAKLPGYDAYVAYCEVAGAVYSGSFLPKGGRVGNNVRNATGERKYHPYLIKLNRQAIDSLESMFVFGVK